MDDYLHCIDQEHFHVCTRHLDSYFLNRAENRCDAYCITISSIEVAKWIHMPVDIPNIYWAVFNIIQGEWERNKLPELTNVESCGLHARWC